jgi:hypothetical protein
VIDLNGKTNSLKRKKSSATIVADVTSFLHQIKRTRFSAHTPSANAWRMDRNRRDHADAGDVDASAHQPGECRRLTRTPRRPVCTEN